MRPILYLPFVIFIHKLVSRKTHERGIMKALVLLTFCLVCYSVNAKTVSVMSYNVENLFDTIHDPGKEDRPRD